MRTIAVDWSGARRPEKAIWLAEVVDGCLVRLEGGRTRHEVTDELIRCAGNGDLIVGLDFAFSFPESFVRPRAVDAFAFWDVVEREGETWLAECAYPFWRAAGSRRPPATDALRATELHMRPQPSSVFQLVGPAQVGPGSIRGIPELRRLRAAGFSVWPFEAASLPLAVEIWPRLYMPDVVKTSRAARLNLLAEYPEIAEPLRAVAASTDDIFDAAVSAVTLWRNRDELQALPALPERRLEGQIWEPKPRLE